jgi:hypothetical protein
MKASMDLADPQWNPLALFFLARKVLPSDWISWEPITVYQELARLGLGKITELNACKLNSVRTLFTSPIAWTDWEAFEKVGHGLTGFIPNFQQIEPLSIGQCAIAIYTMNAIKEIPLADEVIGYVASCAKHQELTYLPKPLDFAMIKLCPPMYKCNDCGQVESLDLEDGRCDHCVGRYRNEHNTIPKDVPYNVGRNVVKYAPYSYLEVKNLYNAVKDLPDNAFDLDLDASGIQVAKLLFMADAVKDYEQAFKVQYHA